MISRLNLDVNVSAVWSSYVYPNGAYIIVHGVRSVVVLGPFGTRMVSPFSLATSPKARVASNAGAVIVTSPLSINNINSINNIEGC